MARLYRSIKLERAKVGEDRTFNMVASTEFPVRRVDPDSGKEFDEILSHENGDVDLSRLKDGAPLLEMHDLNRQRGVIEDAELDGKSLRARARFSKTPEAQKLLDEVNDEIRQHVSIGYDLTGIVSTTKGANGRVQVRFKWAPFEISIVSAPEDPGTGIGRGLRSFVDGTQEEKENMNRILLDPNPAAGGGGAPAPQSAPSPTPDLTVVQNNAVATERTRMKAINDAVTLIADKFPESVEKFRGMAVKAINDGKTAEAFKDELFAALPGVQRAKQITMAGLGMSQQEIEMYSVARGIRSMLVNKGRIDGLEGEVHNAMIAEKIGVEPEGMWVPPDYQVPQSRSMRRRQNRGMGRGKRDLNVSTFNQGGALVPTILSTSLIEIFRNRLVCEALGCQSLSGLAGNVAMPRQTGAATAYAVPESGALTKSTQALDQVPLTPHRVGAWNDYTRQLLLQSGIDVENFIRDDIMKQLAIKWDYLILQGSGANDEPVGILNTPGIGSVHFGGAATWAKILAFETAISVANADVGNIAFVTTPSVRGAWKNIAKIGATFPVFIWDDGEVNGYEALVTNQILNNGVAYGNWEDVIGPAMWGGFDFIVNPYSRDTEGTVRITCNSYGDVVLRHAQSMVWSDDSGAQ